VQHQLVTSVAPSFYLCSTKRYLSSTKPILFKVGMFQKPSDICSTKWCLLRNVRYSFPAAMSFRTISVKIRSASSLAISVRMPRRGAGEKETNPLISLPSITALR